MEQYQKDLRIGQTESTSLSSIKKFPDYGKKNLHHEYQKISDFAKMNPHQEVVLECSQTRPKSTYIMMH